MQQATTELFLKALGVSLILGAVIPLLIKTWADWNAVRVARQRAFDAEREAFRTFPESVAKSARHAGEQGEREQRANDERSQDGVRIGVLLDVYNKQIEKYQTETQARAGWSFLLAVVSMGVGLSFIFWAALRTLSSGSTAGKNFSSHVFVSAVGAAISAFITKTFLDVHKLSLSQLNKYFRQPVLNAHILTAQRLADQLGDVKARESAYTLILERLVLLIRDDDSMVGNLSRTSFKSVVGADRGRGRRARKDARPAAAGAGDASAIAEIK